MDWCRLWHDMPTDPKWRVVARRSGRTIGEIIAVYTLMLVTASKADDRGSLADWDDEDAAAALDFDTENVSAIRKAMQGKVIEQGRLSGWEKRQRKDEGAANRKREQRERQKPKPLESHDENDGVTECHGASRSVTECHLEERRLEESREEKSSVSKDTGAGAPPEEDWEDEKQLFDRGKAVLGKRAGGQVAKLKTTFGIYGARKVVEAAVGKQSPPEYVQAAMKNERKRQEQRDRPTQGQIAAG